MSDLILACPGCQKEVDSEAEFCPTCGAEMDGSIDPNIGRVINDAYAIRELIGVGAIGRVYLAEQLSLKKPVALKLLRKNFARNAEVKARFEREAMAASRLTHPNSITVIDFGESQFGNLFLVAEYIQGTALCDLIAEEEFLEAARVVAILIQVCSALVEAHSQGVIHRDMKPENIMIIRQRDGRDLVKVLDFGIAQIQHSGGPALPRLTRHGLVCGTPEYMSPEQARGEDLDGGTDIYSLGVVMYEALTGTIPFEAEAVMDVVSMHLHDVPEPPSRRRKEADIPQLVERICLRALAKRREDRFEDALELQQALQTVFRDLGLGSELAAEATVDTDDDSPPATIRAAELIDPDRDSQVMAKPKIPEPGSMKVLSAASQFDYAQLEPAQTGDTAEMRPPGRPITKPPRPVTKPPRPVTTPPSPGSGGLRRVSEDMPMVGTVFEPPPPGSSGLELDTSRMRRTTQPPVVSPSRGGPRLLFVVLAVLALLGGALATSHFIGTESTTPAGTTRVVTPDPVKPTALGYADLTDPQKASYRKANKLMIKERYKEAVKILRRLVNKRPRFADGHRQLGTCQLELKQSSDAGKSYRRYLELAPTGRNADTVRKLIEKRGL